MQMKQHNLWHSTDVTNTRTFLQRTTRLRMLPTMPRQEVTTVATPEIQNISLWGNIYSRRMLQWWSAHHVQLLVILLETFRRGIVHCHQTFFSIQFVNYFRSWASIFILQYFNIRLSPEAVKGLWRIYLFVFLKISQELILITFLD